MNGLFVSFEGPEGAGKSTQVELLREALARHRPVVVREPGGTPLGEQIRRLLLESRLEMSPEAEMYLFMAARAELVDRVIAPALRRGGVVIADRYHDSTLAYQGGGRGADTLWPESFPRPDLTFLLVLPVEVGLLRQARAGKRADRIESEALPFHRALMAEYQRLATAEPQRYVRIEADRPAADVHAQVLARVMPLLQGVAT